MREDERAVTARLRAASGDDLAGVFAFGDSEEMADRLLGWVLHGAKRATAGLLADYGDDEPLPQVGDRWGLLDGRGAPQAVVETVEVRVGPVASVDPAFAWDEGENDRTREGWLADHRAFFRRQGVADPDGAEAVFERFRVVWPQPDDVTWLADGVRETRPDERAWIVETLTRRWGGTDVVSRGALIDAATLPALVAERDGVPAGLLTFLPRPEGQTEIVTVDAFPAGAGTAGRLLDGVAALGRRNGWRRLWVVTTNDNTPALRAYQRRGFDLVALHRNAVVRSRERKPRIPATGVDGIPIDHELELELRLA
ncbi:MAG TPA: GNAT family N-acetyltransferase [Euzebyales bacterium]|nr:GNAT family N-acetyltransferase [Euzebyales bacterium]